MTNQNVKTENNGTQIYTDKMDFFVFNHRALTTNELFVLLIVFFVF
jgi:hypothetical protein